MRLAGILSSFIAAVLLAGMSGLVTWYLMRETPKPPAAAKPAAPATVLKEADLLILKLTPEAETRLGLQTIPIERRTVSRTRSYGGEIMIPAGQAMTVAAPLSGTLRNGSGAPVRVGDHAKKGQLIFQLVPLLAPEARANLAAALVEAEGQVKNATTQMEAARIALTRARQLFQQEAGSKRGLDEAQAQYDLASKTLEAAQARHELFARIGHGDAIATIVPLMAPADGLLRTVHAVAGAVVPANAPLFEVVVLDPLWVRVPVYVGERAEIVADQPAEIGNTGDRPGTRAVTAKPVAAPPSADALMATVDFYYELKNPDGRFAPGQRVSAVVPLQSKAESLVVPWSAIIHDLYGGTWVYEQTEPHRYVRRRVQVRHVAGNDAVLADGPKPGTRVVTAGAAELFGAEVGFSK